MRFQSLFMKKNGKKQGKQQSRNNTAYSRPVAEQLEGRDLPSVNASPGAILLTHPGNGGETPFGGGGGPSGYTPAQIRHAYGFDQVSFNGTVGDGSGTTIAIVDAYNDPTIAADLSAFDSQFGIAAPPSFSVVSQTGSTNLPSSNTGWAGEISLDVEWAHAIAPGAKILLVEASSSSETNLFAAVKYAASQPGVVAVSMSWGGSEFSGENSSDSTFTTPTGHTGVAFVVSSGDAGAPVSYPSSSPNVLSVGGTSSYLTSSNTLSSESAWSGSGGGISAYEVVPSYQQGLSVYGISSALTKRANPDVSYDSDPNTGFPVYENYGNSTFSSNPWLQYGGTSDAAPQWSALIAIADQGRALAGESALSNSTLLPLIYQLPASDFHDVTSGKSTGSPNYSAGPGYDLATGRGTPVANAVISGLVGTPSGPVATHFSVASSVSSTTAGTSFTVTVTALGSSNQTIAGYTGTVQFTSTDAQAVLPPSYTFTSADAGVHTFSITLKTAGTESITATDLASSSIKGSASVSVSAAATSIFKVTGPSSVSVGATASFTVTSSDAYGNPTTGYSGTVHFSSSDAKAQLPANSVLTNGTGTFSATFGTVGTQTFTATDTVTSSLTGSATLSVNAGAPTHIVFLQEPSNVAATSTMTPAVKVELVDANGNLVTTDNTDQVSLTIGINPGSGTLGGGGPVTVSGGIATFPGVTLSKAGTGYTLVASSGTLPTVTSTPFTVSPPPASPPPPPPGTVIEAFNNGLNSYYYTGSSYPLAYISSAAAHDGANGLDDVGDGDWYLRNDSAGTIKPGDTVTVWVEFSGAADGRAYFGVGTTFHGTFSVVLAPNTNQILIQSNPGFGTFNNLASISQTFAANTWYHLEVDWSTSGKVLAKLFGSDGQTLLNSLSAATGDTTPGGFAFRAIGSDKYFDTVADSHVMNSFSVLPSTSGSTSLNGFTTTIANPHLSSGIYSALELPVVNPIRKSQLEFTPSVFETELGSPLLPFGSWFPEVG